MSYDEIYTAVGQVIERVNRLAEKSVAKKDEWQAHIAIAEENLQLAFHHADKVLSGVHFPT